MEAEPTPVEIVADEVWIAEKFQSNSEIAGSPPEIALGLALRMITGGKALNDSGAERLPKSIKLRMPDN